MIVFKETHKMIFYYGDTYAASD